MFVHLLDNKVYYSSVMHGTDMKKKNNLNSLPNCKTYFLKGQKLNELVRRWSLNKLKLIKSDRQRD